MTRATIADYERDLIKDGATTVLDKHQVAAILRCSLRSVQRFRDDGDLASVHPQGSGRPLIFYRREVARYLAES